MRRSEWVHLYWIQYWRVLWLAWLLVSLSLPPSQAGEMLTESNSGSGPQYCMAGCQSLYGMCSISNSSVVTPPMTSPSTSAHNSMNGSWTSTATVTECGVCESMTSSGSTMQPAKSTTFPSPYTGAAVPRRYMDAKSWVVASFMAFLWLL